LIAIAAITAAVAYGMRLMALRKMTSPGDRGVATKIAD
jgi:hypothetical protein